MMTPLSVFGVIAVSAMLLFYAVEERSPLFILLFAGACLASSAYGFLQGAWPFGVVEGIWTVVAIQRWRRHRPRARDTQTQPAHPFACNTNAFAGDERQRYDALRAKVTGSIVHVAELPNGYRVQLGQAVTSGEAGEWMAFEQRCCPFLSLTLELEEGSAIWLALTGRPGVKEVLEREFAVLRVNRS